MPVVSDACSSKAAASHTLGASPQRHFERAACSPGMRMAADPSAAMSLGQQPRICATTLVRWVLQHGAGQARRGVRGSARARHRRGPRCRNRPGRPASWHPRCAPPSAACACAPAICDNRGRVGHVGHVAEARKGSAGRACLSRPRPPAAQARAHRWRVTPRKRELVPRGPRLVSASPCGR